MRTIGAAGLVLAALLVSPPAQAEEDARSEQNDDAATALVAGAGVTFASLTAGGILVAGSDDLFVKNAGLIGGQSGMVLAPLVAHAVVGETKRGIWFSLPLLAPVATTSLMAGLHPSVIKRAPAGIQYITYISLAFSIVGGTLGVLDAVRVNERKTKKSAWSIVPLVGGGTTGAVFSGSL